MMSEKTLAIIAVSLTFLLVVVIIIIFVQFREVPPPSDSIDNAVERVQDADTTPSTDEVYDEFAKYPRFVRKSLVR